MRLRAAQLLIFIFILVFLILVFIAGVLEVVKGTVDPRSPAWPGRFQSFLKEIDMLSLPLSGWRCSEKHPTCFL